MAKAVLVTSMTDYMRRFGGFRRDSYLTYTARAFFENGGSRLYVVRIVGTVSGPPSSPPVAPAAAALSPGGSALALSAANEGVWGNSISVQIVNSSDGDARNFKLIVLYAGNPVESFDSLTFQNSPTTLPGATSPGVYGRTSVNGRSEYIAITAEFTTRPVNSTIALTGGNDGPPVQPSDFIGAAAADNTRTGTGLHALDKVTDVNLIALPGRGDSATVNAGMEYCKNRQLQDCFFIGDMGTVTSVDAARIPGAVTTVRTIADAQTFATAGSPPLDKAAGDYGAVYFPWIWSGDPIGVGLNPKILLPPSGFLAGIYARIDNSRGVFKAPAGIEAGVSGALATPADVSDAEQDQLNPVSVNVIRTVPGSGFVVWGTRTIGSDASWRYIPVRRMAIFLRTSIYYGIQWAVFEPNDEPLWASLRLNIRSFMLTQFRAGAFQGSKPDDAFFVMCDKSTTTQQDIDNGVVNILVGLAPLKPAEFVVLKLSQKVNQPAV